jgi:HAE1 family hydrophobic/amphiphilic exporter-1
MLTGGSNQGSFEIEIRGNLELAELDRLAQELIRRLQELGGFVDLSSSLKLGLPEVRIVPDREKAAALGIDARSVAQAIHMMIGGMDVGVFKEEGRRYDIRMRLEPEDRADPAQIAISTFARRRATWSSCATWSTSKPGRRRRRSRAPTASAR